MSDINPGKENTPATFAAKSSRTTIDNEQGYVLTGRNLALSIEQIIGINRSLSNGCTIKLLDELEDIIKNLDHDKLKSWLSTNVPRIMSLVPEHRHDAFLEGFIQASKETGSERRCA